MSLKMTSCEPTFTLCVVMRLADVVLPFGRYSLRCSMFDGFDEQRVAAMTSQEHRWFDNVKKAFYESDDAIKNGTPEDRCLEELFKAVDTAKTLRRSLRGEDTSHRDNRKRFIEFLGLEIPIARTGSSEFELRETESGQLRKFTFGEIVYAIRCKVHENENLNIAEDVDYHILLDWTIPHPSIFAHVIDGQFVCNGYFLWNRLREVLSKFITCLDTMIAFANNASSFSISIRPRIGSIMPDKKNQ
jgi:hypothetical protein